MLKSILSSSNTIAPDVFIDSSEINFDKIKVFYHLENNETDWMNNSSLIENLNVYIYLNDTGSIESVKSLKSRSEVKNNKIYNFVELPTGSNNVVLSAYCGNDLIRGKQVTEDVLVYDRPAKSENFTYLNKNKDLRLLNITRLDTGSQAPEFNEIQNDLLVSYNTNKRATLGYVFNLENYLHKNSKLYRAFEKIPYYKNLILSASYINPSEVSFYKKNLTKNTDYQKINTPVYTYYLNQNSISSSCIFTAVDDNEDINNRDKYAVKIKINIQDYSYNVLKDHLLKPFRETKEDIVYYKNLFQSIIADNSIQEKNIYFLNNKYPAETERVRRIVHHLSMIYAFYSKDRNRQDFASLFLSILHPMTMREDLLDLMLDSVNSLESIFSFIVGDISQPVIDNFDSKVFDATYEHEFSYKDMQNKQFYDSIDYDYNAYSGYEIFSFEDVEIRNSKELTGLDVITSKEKFARKRLESKKYFNLENNDFFDRIQDFSMSVLDLNGVTYNMTLISPTDITFYNNLYMNILQYNESMYFNDPSYYWYYDLLKKNVYIKTIGARNNGEINGLFPSTVNDANEQTRQQTLQLMTDTGINYLFYIMDKNEVIFPSDVIQAFAAVPDNTNNYNSTFLLPDEVLKDPMMKPKIICYYNNIYKDRLIHSGSSFSVYSLEEGIVHEIFTKNLQLFNKYYIVSHLENPEDRQIPIFNSFKLINDILLSVDIDSELEIPLESKNYNRNLSDSIVFLTTSEI